MDVDSLLVAKRENLMRILLILFVLYLGACAAEPGFFAFGASRQQIKSYKGTPVFPADKPLHWAYQVRGSFNPNLFGVKLERNELGWLRIETMSLKADKEVGIVSMSYPPMKPGLYRITIYHRQKEIDKGHFRLVQPDEYR